MMNIPQTDPLAEYRSLKNKIDQVVSNVLDGGWYILGEQVSLFEREFASYVDVDHAVGVASGTDAVSLALMACGIGPGDEVITVSHTAVATVAAIERCGALPVLVDIDERTYCMDPLCLADALSKRTKAIVPVHLYGLCVDMQAILQFAEANGLKVIEDCAQAHGSEFLLEDERWFKAGSMGHAAAFSFYPTKNLGALGDGGCVVTNDCDIAGQVRLLRQYGWRERYVSDIAGWNSRLDELQAAILRVKLAYLDKHNSLRRDIARIYDDALLTNGIDTPFCPQNRNHVYHQYVIRSSCRDRVREALAASGISTAIHYSVPVHKQPAYVGRTSKRELPVTERVCQEILSLPMFPYLAGEQLRAVSEAVADVLQETC